jgi:hypothetical protein
MIDGILGVGCDTGRCGVARFNAQLAERLRVPCVDLLDLAAGRLRHPLISVKPSEISPAQADALALRSRLPCSVFLHEWSGGTSLIGAGVDTVYTGNAEVAALARADRRDVTVVDAWCPGLLDVGPALSVLIYGMGHKLAAGAEHHRRLRELLDATGQSYHVLLSMGSHMLVDPSASRAAVAEMSAIYGPALRRCGHLADADVVRRIRACTYVAGFFPAGVRANNTTASAVLELGRAVLVTNLDRYSPGHMRHMATVVDVERCKVLPTDPVVLRQVAAAAAEVAPRWPALVELMS